MFSLISETQYDEVSECLDIAGLVQYFQVLQSCLCSITIVVVSAIWDTASEFLSPARRRRWSPASRYR